MGDCKSGCLPDYIAKIKEKVAELSSRHSAFLQTPPLIAFRGEPDDYGATKLMPSLFRDSSYIAKESHLFELFCDYSIVGSNASNIEKAIEAQHYASVSRMLDISFDVLVSLLVGLSNANIRFSRNGSEVHIPGNLSLSFPGHSGEALLHRLDLMGICVSTGSACNSAETQVSHVLKAIGLDETEAKGTIRLSFGKDNIENDIDAIVDALRKILG